MKYVISLGGSIIVPDKINTNFIRRFVDLISRRAKKGHTFFIVTGGGATARKYISAARGLQLKVSNFDLDWMGISATKLNAQLLSVAFGGLARKGIINDPSESHKKLARVNVVSGWKPGWSTDYVATRIAATYGIKLVINLSNIDYIYSADPRKHKNAKKIRSLTWEEFRKKFGSKWDPGANLPFDPVGAKLAQRQGISVVVLNGRDIGNLKKFLAGKFFRGTVIK